MIHHLDLSLELPYRICLSTSKRQSGWAIIFPDKISVLINPTAELLKFCKDDKIIQINPEEFNDCPKNIQIATANIRIGSYLNDSYIFLDGQILFSCRVPQCSWNKLMKKLKAQLLLTDQGAIYNSAEVGLISLVC